MMDNRYLGDTFGGFAHKCSGGGSSFPALTSYDNTATAYEDTKSSNQLSIHKDSAVKKKRLSKITGGGLRQFSIIVCKKIERKGRTTYNEFMQPSEELLFQMLGTIQYHKRAQEVADEIIADFTGINNGSAVSLDESDEKNIRRRVYDALNVLMALDIIAKDKKAIWWKGLQNTDVKDLEQLKALHVKLSNRIGKKAAYLKELEEQIAGLQNLMSRNQQLSKSGNVPSGRISLPFILVQTSPHATVEIEISENMRLVHFDFNSTPFSLHDDAYILKLLRCYQLPESRHGSQNSSVHPSSSSEIASGGTRPFYWNSEIDTWR